jgi:glycosyltransferase involved in cell wall biosynthesis
MCVRILMILEAFRSIGGIEEVVDHLAMEFQHAGHEVSVVSTPNVPAGCERTPLSKAVCSYIDIPSCKPPSWRHPERLFRWPSGLSALTAAISAASPDIVSSHEWEWDKLPVIAESTRRAGAPFVQSLYDWRGQGRLGPKALHALDHATALISLSEATRSYFSNLTRAADKAKVITGGVDCDAADAAIAYQRPRPYILSAGRIDLRSKAFDDLLFAFAEIAPKLPDIDLVIAGEGPDRRQLEHIAETASISKRLQFEGNVSRENLWRLHKGASLFVMPSRQPEGLGLVFLEAMACGVAVIGTNSGGTPEIVTEATGRLIAPGDRASLVAAMLELLRKPELRDQTGRRGRESVRGKYAWSRMATHYLDVFQQTVTAN